MILLKSAVTKKLLYYFFVNPNESLYLNEMVRKFKIDKRNLVKKIRELELEGILESEFKANTRFVRINKDYPLYNEYKKIILKTLGLENKFKEIIEKIKRIKTIYIYGSYARNSMDVHSDIDILVLGTHNIVDFQREINKLQGEIDREFNVTHMDEEEFKKRRNKKDPFLTDILSKKHIIISK